ncbi:uncharacterized protein [Nicotiana tomentosiformis]|uniref:uncharacterized protein n=1 Tax=Nicotiana tomentosiformis TaxID=4098 RepID=UPI00388CBFA7
MLQVLKEKKLYAKFSWLDLVAFLGYVVGGLRWIQRRLKRFKVGQTFYNHEDQEFSGVDWVLSSICGRVFIHCNPIALNKFTQNGAPFRWSDECEESFQKLKIALTTTSKYLNLRQRRWLELLKDYDITILYHPEKSNMVADALSRKVENMGSLAFIPAVERPLAKDVQALSSRLVRLDISELSRVLVCVVSRVEFVFLMSNGLRELILEETHSSRYSIHPGAMKMYHDLKKYYWWRRINKDIVRHVSRCLNCQQKYHEDKPYVLDFSIVQLDENLAFKEELVAILDRQVQKLRLNNIALVKVHWRGHLDGEATWEIEHDMWSRYPNLFGTPSIILNSFKDECLFKRERMK